MPAQSVTQDALHKSVWDTMHTKIQVYHIYKKVRANNNNNNNNNNNKTNNNNNKTRWIQML